MPNTAKQDKPSEAPVSPINPILGFNSICYPNVFESQQNDSERYFNRELSLLQFHQRVLAQATNPRHPLLERLFFLIIFSSNLDEFFEIRVAGLMQKVQMGDFRDI